jgi:hypothetical protein
MNTCLRTLKFIGCLIYFWILFYILGGGLGALINIIWGAALNPIQLAGSAFMAVFAILLIFFISLLYALITNKVPDLMKRRKALIATVFIVWFLWFLSYYL